MKAITERVFIVQPSDDNRISWSEALYTLKDKNKEGDPSFMQRILSSPVSDDVSPLDSVFLRHKEKEQNFHIVFINTLDPSRASSLFWENLKNNYKGDEYVYVIDSWEFPHSSLFKNFNVNTTPKLVTSFIKFFVEEDYLPNIYTKLGLSSDSVISE